MPSVASPAAARTIAVVTYSIVARDPQTGELGAALQSHWFAVSAVGTADAVLQLTPDDAAAVRELSHTATTE